jgi:hypothetical protein
MMTYYVTGGNGSFIQVQHDGVVHYADTVDDDTNLDMSADEALVYLEQMAESGNWPAQPAPLAGDFTADQMLEYVGAV